MTFESVNEKLDFELIGGNLKATAIEDDYYHGYLSEDQTRKLYEDMKAHFEPEVKS